jgi:hypothetical protein
MKSRTPNLRIGDLVLACEDGRKAGLRRRPGDPPGWLAGSPTLLMAYSEGFVLARRSRKGATDGPAR